MEPKYAKVEEHYDVPMDKILEYLGIEYNTRLHGLSIHGQSGWSMNNERIVSITVTRTKG